MRNIKKLKKQKSEYLFHEAEKMEDLRVTNKLPYDPLIDLSRDELENIIKEDSVQFSNSMEKQLGGLLKSGFILEDFYKDYSNSDDYLLSQICRYFMELRL